MDVSSLKQYILDEKLVCDILESIKCHSIKEHNNYITCANSDGTNKNAIVVYLNENLTTINYTRCLSKTKRTTDIIDLVMFNEDLTFPEALKFLCNELGLDFYNSGLEDVPESLQIIKMLQEMNTNSESEDNEPLKPINEKILSYYIPYGNKMWEKEDNISLGIQEEFSIGFDPCTNYITIPIYDEIGSLVGIKGRYYGSPDEYHPKYLSLERYSKGRVLYGYWQNKNYIKNNKFLYVVESEKSVLKLAEFGIRNAVATGGKKISKYQIEMISRTGCIPILSYDKDCDEVELSSIANMFMDGINVYAIIDKNNLLNEKESPMDRQEIWEILKKNNTYKIR